jgi:diacylglycerol O-acyltransferase
MQQLSALDASFIFNESPTCSQHIGNIGIFDPSTAPNGEVRFKQIMQTMVDRMHLVPLLRQRLIEVPFNADFPYWINEESFDPEFHIRHISLPAPGDWRQLCIQVARIYSRPLDRNKPLWEMYVIEGLDNVEGLPKGCFATLTKTHHATLDGSSASDVGAALTDFTANPDETSIPPSGSWIVDKVPSDAELLTRANFHNMTKPLRFLETLGQTAPKVQEALEQIRAGTLKLPSSAPRTRFNGSVDASRVFEAVTFELETIKKIKNVVGGTVNDVMLAICSGALRHYLIEKDELPEASLISLCPINTRTAETDSANLQTGNNVSSMAVALRTDIEDTKERLQAICEETRNAKELTKAIGAKTMLEYAQYMPTTLSALGAKVAAEQGLANHMDPVFNTVTTNVPGPPIPLYSNGARLVSGFGLGIVQDMVGLFHTIGSYCGQATISITCCRSMMPDPAHYADLLRQSMDELDGAFLDTPKPVKKPKKAAKKTTAKTPIKKVAKVKK